MPIACLAELDFAEGPAFDHVENEGVDLGADRLHDVEREGLATLGVGVDDPEPGVEPDGLAGEDRLRLDE